MAKRRTFRAALPFMEERPSWAWTWEEGAQIEIGVTYKTKAGTVIWVERNHGPEMGPPSWNCWLRAEIYSVNGRVRKQLTKGASGKNPPHAPISTPR